MGRVRAEDVVGAVGRSAMGFEGEYWYCSSCWCIETWMWDMDIGDVYGAAVWCVHVKSSIWLLM